MSTAAERMAKARAAKAAKREAETAVGSEAEAVQEAARREVPQAVSVRRRPAARPPVRSEAGREPIHRPVRGGAVAARGRSGEVLTRSRPAMGDVYDVPIEIVPDGWTYQWNTVTVLNEQTSNMQLHMYANGWRPVPAERHPGRWMPIGAKGEILVNGLRLEERPASLTMEAKMEATEEARRLISDRNESLRLTSKTSAKHPGGGAAGPAFAERGYRGTGPRVAMSIDPGSDIPRPEYELSDE